MSFIDWSIDRFATWFASSSCVWQTSIAILGWLVYWLFNPQIDTHGLGFLFILTVYSAITQPALAYASDRATRAAAASVDSQSLLLRNQADMMITLIALAEQLQLKTIENREILDEISETHEELDEFIHQERRHLELDSHQAK